MSGAVFDFLSAFINQGRYAEIAPAAHAAWRSQKEQDGWRYGRRRSERRRRHPLLVPFEKLSEADQIASRLSTYSTTNFFRTRFAGASLPELKQVFERLLAGEDAALMDELGEYVHSHFVAGQIARQRTVQARPDMVVYEALEADVQALDLVIARSTIRFLLAEIEDTLG